MTVDSMPFSHGPPSRIISQAAPRPLATCAAVEGLMPPLGFAEGATIGTFMRSSKSSAAGCEGTRMASVSEPAEANGVITLFLGLCKINVIAPGQNAAARRAAASLGCPAARAASAEEKWLISGLNFGRCFAKNMRATAVASVANAPNP